MMHLSAFQFGSPSRVPAALPKRPDSGVLNRSIPLFFISRNRHGFWLVREANGRAGGMFLLRRSALRFAQEGAAVVIADVNAEAGNATAQEITAAGGDTIFARAFG